jgi:hypothetical protein
MFVITNECGHWEDAGTRTVRKKMCTVCRQAAYYRKHRARILATRKSHDKALRIKRNAQAVMRYRHICMALWRVAT